MKRFGKAFIVVLLAWAMPTATGWAQATAAQQPAVAYSVDGVLYIATESGSVLRTVEIDLPIGDFTISPDLGTVVFSLPHPDATGGPLFILNLSTGALTRMAPDPYFNDATVADVAEFYADPDFSSDGERVVFAAHAQDSGDEVQTSGPLAVLDLKTREITILKDTIGESGLPLGYMHDPHWSPDGKQILANIEWYAFVTDSAGKVLAEVVIPENELSQSSQSYGMYAMGWLGSRCVLYQAGEDPERDPVRIFHLGTGKTSPAAEALRLPEQSLRGILALSGRLWTRNDPMGFRVEGPGISWLIRGDTDTTFVRLLRRAATDDTIPADCK
jgi:hypothetical protein